MSIEFHNLTEKDRLFLDRLVFVTKTSTLERYFRSKAEKDGTLSVEEVLNLPISHQSVLDILSWMSRGQAILGHGLTVDRFFVPGDVKVLPKHSLTRVYAKEIVLLDGVECIEQGVFGAEVEKIYVPKTVLDLDSYLSHDVFTTDLLAFDVARENPKYSSRDGVLFNKDQTKLLKCPTALKECRIPDGVLTVGENAFYDCYGLTSVYIPDTVTTLEMSAFAGCTNLASVRFSNSLTAVPTECFYECPNLISIDLPDSVTTIQDNAFYCSPYFDSDEDFHTVRISESVKNLASNAFNPDFVTLLQGNKILHEAVAL